VGKHFLENSLLLNFPADGYIPLEYGEKPDDPIADIQACLTVVSEAAERLAPSRFHR
jgi:hypothetical protein